MEHYILIRVNEEETTSRTKASFLRWLIHRVASDNNIIIADNLIREDRNHLPNGNPVPYEEAKRLFSKIM